MFKKILLLSAVLGFGATATLNYAHADDTQTQSLTDNSSSSSSSPSSSSSASDTSSSSSDASSVNTSDASSTADSSTSTDQSTLPKAGSNDKMIVYSVAGALVVISGGALLYQKKQQG